VNAILAPENVVRPLFPPLFPASTVSRHAERVPNHRRRSTRQVFWRGPV